jgi:hypothetical protein
MSAFDPKRTMLESNRRYPAVGRAHVMNKLDARDSDGCQKTQTDCNLFKRVAPH